LKTYSYLLPKLYSQRPKFLNQQVLREMCEAGSPAKVAQILKEHGYEIEGAPRDLIELAYQVERAAQERIDKIVSLSPEEAGSFIEILDSWDKLSSIIIAVKIFESTGDVNRALSAISWLKDESLKSSIAQGTLVLGSSPPQLKAILSKVFDGEVREIVEKSVKSMEEGGGVAVLQLSFLLNLKELLSTKISELSQSRKREVLDVVCGYLDYLFLITSVNAYRIEGSKNTSSLISRMRGCRLSGREILEALQSGNVQTLYTNIISAYGESPGKGESAEIQMIRVLRKKLKRVAEHRYASYPFTPALPLAAALAIKVESAEIMKLLLEMSTGLSCSEAQQNSAL